MTLPIRPPFDPMLATLVRAVPASGDVYYEPKWDGFRCVVFRDGADLDLQSRNHKPLLRYFPELEQPLLDQLPARCVVDGELVVATPSGLDFEALQLRQHPAASRVAKLSVEIPASFVAFDVLAIDDASLLDVAFWERRAELERLLASAEAPCHVTPVSRDRAVALDWFERFEGAGFDGLMVKPADGRYLPGQRAMVKVKHERTADCVVAGYRLHKDRGGVGSLLLGLYDGVELHHVGVAAGMSASVRHDLLAQVEPLRANALEDHPWREWAELARPTDGDDHPARRMPGGGSRWNAGKDLSWEPLRIERVAEVRYEGMLGRRFRHNARFRRWRDDRDPASCTYDQLERPPPAELLGIFTH